MVFENRDIDAPRQPTVEVRCLPGSLDPAATLARVELARAFLARVLRG